MNKDVIYIEPEDDITDIITKIESSKQKIVALVPPKKAGVFRSVVNIKLIAKAGKTAEKSVVLVTVDPSITKLAATSKLPVAKNLQSAPAIPELDADIEESSKEAVDEDGKSETEEDTPKKSKEEPKNTTEDETDETEDEEDEEDEEPEEKPSKPTKGKKSPNKIIDWVKNHQKLSILIGIGGLGLIAFLVWALFVAPSVDIFVSIKTESNNFSEALTFVKELSAENAEEGKLYLEEKKVETIKEVNFEATGVKNRGEKASGEVKVSGYFKFNRPASSKINVGDKFTISGLTYTATKVVPLVYDGNGADDCKNKGNPAELVTTGCEIEESVPVAAVEPGAKYNIAASASGWSTNATVHVRSEKPMTGGTDKTYTVVQQIDVEKAKSQLESTDEAENKEKLYDSIPEDSLILESTFSQSTSNATPVPAIDEEVKDGVKPTLKTVTTTSVFIIDKTKLEEFIKTKVNLPDDKKIFDIRNVYIDGFKETNGSFAGKLKAVYYTGPKITETELVDKIKGMGIGDARRVISDIDGISEVKINQSYPWVFAVPTDSNRITITFEIKDQDGGKIEEKPESSENSAEKPTSEEKKP